MKKKCIAVIFLVTLSIFFISAQTQKTNIVLLVDTSGTMLSYYEETNSRILTEVSKKFIRTGDTVHLISFSKEPQIEFTQTIQTQKDVKKLTEQCSLLFPIGIHADLLAAAAYSEKYIESLEKNSRKILVIITDGKNNPSPSSQYYSLSAEKTEAELQNKITQLKTKNIVTYIAKAPYKNPDALTSSKIAVIDNSAQNHLEQTPATITQETQNFQADVDAETAHNNSQKQTPLSLPQVTDSKIANTQKQQDIPFSTEEKPNVNTEINKKYKNEETKDYEKAAIASNTFSQSNDSAQQPIDTKTKRNVQSAPDNKKISDSENFSEFSQQSTESKQTDLFEPRNNSLHSDSSDSIDHNTMDEPAAADFENSTKGNESAATASVSQNSKSSKTNISSKNRTAKTLRNQNKKPQKQSNKSVSNTTNSSSTQFSFNKNYLFIAATICGIILMLILIMVLARLRNRKNAYTQKKTSASDSIIDLSKLNIERNSSMPKLTAADKQNNSMPVLDSSVKRTSSMPTLNSIAAEKKQTNKNNLLKIISDTNSKLDTQKKGASEVKQDTASYRPANSTEIIDQKGTDSITLEMTVDKQNRNIGLRNVHTLVPGSRKSVGGGFSAFSIFVVQVPASIAEIRYDGVSCSLAIFQPQFFPHEQNAVIENCIGRPVIVRSANGFEMKLLFTNYKSKTEALNELLLSVIPEENKKRYLHNKTDNI